MPRLFNDDVGHGMLAMEDHYCIDMLFQLTCASVDKSVAYTEDRGY